MVYFQCHRIITKADVILMPVSFGQDTVACIYTEAHLHIHLLRGAIYIDKEYNRGGDALSVALEETLSLTALRPGDGHRASTD